MGNDPWTADPHYGQAGDPPHPLNNFEQWRVVFAGGTLTVTEMCVSGGWWCRHRAADPAYAVIPWGRDKPRPTNSELGAMMAQALDEIGDLHGRVVYVDDH